MESIVVVLISVVVLILLFFVLRSINLWYFRINEALEKMDKQNELLTEIKNHLAGNAPGKVSASGHAAKVEAAAAAQFEKNGNSYSVPGGLVFTVEKAEDSFYFVYNGKKYHYTDLKAIENSVREIAAGNEPSKKDLIAIKN